MIIGTQQKSESASSKCTLAEKMGAEKTGQMRGGWFCHFVYAIPGVIPK